MKISLLCCSFVFGCSVLAFAEAPVSGTALPVAANETMQTSGVGSGKVVLLAQNSNRDQETNAAGKLKGWAKNNKGKGKGKGSDRSTGEKETEAAAPTAATTAPAVATNAVPAAAPALPQKAESAASPAVKPSTAPSASKTQVRAELGQRINRINTLDNSQPLASAGLAAVAKETGVRLSLLQAQQKEYQVGTGGLLVANEMAKATHKPTATFLKQRLAKRDWEVMAAENNFDLAPMLPKLSRVEAAMEAARAQLQKKR